MEDNNSLEKCNDNILYNDNYIKNYEDLACCNNLILSTIIQENGNHFMNYINDLCFRKEDINDNEQIMKNPFQQNISTPLCSNHLLSTSIIFSNIISILYLKDKIIILIILTLIIIIIVVIIVIIIVIIIIMMGKILEVFYLRK